MEPTKERQIARMACIKAASVVVAACKDRVKGSVTDETIKMATRFETYIFSSVGKCSGENCQCKKE